jgi:hypothetical protein
MRIKHFCYYNYILLSFATHDQCFTLFLAVCSVTLGKTLLNTDETESC